jgi:hypothetical protein
MTVTYELQPHFEWKGLAFASFFRKSPVEWLATHAIKKLHKLLDNAILSTIGLRQVSETQFAPSHARKILPSFEKQALRLQSIASNLGESDISDPILVRYVHLNEEVLKALLTLKAVALLDVDAEKIILEPFEIQDEVMRIAAFRIEPGYWDEPDRKLWLEAELS